MQRGGGFEPHGTSVHTFTCQSWYARSNVASVVRLEWGYRPSQPATFGVFRKIAVAFCFVRCGRLLEGANVVSIRRPFWS